MLFVESKNFKNREDEYRLKKKIIRETLKAIVYIGSGVALLYYMNFVFEDGIDRMEINVMVGGLTCGYLIFYLNHLVDLPVRLEIRESSLIVNYIFGRKEIIDFDSIEDCNLLIHSKRTSRLKLVTSEGILLLYKDKFFDFTKFTKQISNELVDKGKFKVYFAERKDFKERCEYDLYKHNIYKEWYDFLEDSISIKDVLNDIKKDNSTRWIISNIIFVGIIVVARVGSFLTTKTLICAYITITLLWSVSDILLRKIGYSSQESSRFNILGSLIMCFIYYIVIYEFYY